MTGPSGAGKGTLEKELLRRMPELELAVSATTRERRPGEREGREYWYLDADDFQRRVEAGDFLEHVTYVSGHRYGTLRSELDRIAERGRVALLDLEIEGALRVRDEVPGAITIFIKAPSVDELERRLRDRATESAGEIGERLALARRQMEYEGEFHHVVLNDDVARAADELAGIVRDAIRASATLSRP